MISVPVSGRKITDAQPFERESAKRRATACKLTKRGHRVQAGRGRGGRGRAVAVPLRVDTKYMSREGSHRNMSRIDNLSSGVCFADGALALSSAGWRILVAGVKDCAIFRCESSGSRMTLHTNMPPLSPKRASRLWYGSQVVLSLARVSMTEPLSQYQGNGLTGKTVINRGLV